MWTYGKDTFLPHGTRARRLRRGAADLSDHGEVENPNGATILVLVDGAAGAPTSRSFDRCLDLFDGGDAEAVEPARERWREARAAGPRLTYWQQTERGGWVKAASG